MRLGDQRRQLSRKIQSARVSNVRRTEIGVVSDLDGQDHFHGILRKSGSRDEILVVRDG
jgi:hypothetical protein